MGANVSGTAGEETARHMDRRNIIDGLPNTEGDGEQNDLETGIPREHEANEYNHSAENEDYQKESVGDGDCGSLSLRCRLRTGRYHWRMARLRYKCSLRHPSSSPFGLKCSSTSVLPLHSASSS